MLCEEIIVVNVFFKQAVQEFNPAWQPSTLEWPVQYSAVKRKVSCTLSKQGAVLSQHSSLESERTIADN